MVHKYSTKANVFSYSLSVFFIFLKTKLMFHCFCSDATCTLKSNLSIKLENKCNGVSTLLAFKKNVVECKYKVAGN